MDDFPRRELEIKLPVEIEQYERKIYDLKQLIEISKGLNSTLDYNTLIDSILLTCMGQMQLIKAGIFLKKSLGADAFSLHRNYKGFDVDHARDHDLHRNSPLIKYIESVFKCYELPELLGRFDNDPSMEVLITLSPCLVVPLICKGEINGIIILGGRINEDKFSESEKEYLLNIASLAGIAIHNASLYEMATTDMMTGLKIHHYFQTILIEEFDRAVKYTRPLSLIMADIDNFKNFNDSYGHSAGDLVIKNVAHIIRESIRQIDIASRYGGEEFAVILPRTDIHEALIVAERIRSSVEQEVLHYHNQSLRVTISIGIAQHDSKIDHDRNDVIERADKALYISKKNGRNRVSFL
ncbi:MAG TPA: diguanylate cyclase DgcA [Spirochaetota bacterium]|nr:diguanylate cyclase DgcA [Spirochaetota bacterium]HPI89486.1 diguanylate cyclase DgcA [Spirochaetota bacterium]HPR49343.1 diguanylate cyclase DgcA [Spirochaetota bacterium]